MPHPRENGKIPEPVLALLCGLFVGFICGFQGTGGGLWMLFALNILLRFEYRKAVGTSVSIMTLTALIGAFGHFFIHEMPDLLMLSLCVVSTLIGAQGAALIANRISPKLLKRLLAAKGAALPEAKRAEYEKLLIVPEDVTRTMMDFTKDPAPYEAHRLKLAAAIAELSK